MKPSPFVRSKSGSLQREMTNQGKIYVSSESNKDIPATGVCIIIDGIITSKSLTKLLNEKLLTKSDRFKSIVTNDGYYKLIPSFDSSQILTTFNIDNNKLLKNNLDINKTENKLEIIEKYLSIHISKYHNQIFEKRDKLPLWRSHLLLFKDLNLSVFYLKSHHCICDGITMGDIFLSLSDNYNTIINDMKQKRDSLKTYKQYKKMQKERDNSWIMWFQYILSLMFMICKFTVYAFKTMICRRETRSLFKPKQQTVLKSYSVLLRDNLTIKSINKQRHKYQFSQNIKITLNDYMIALICEGLNNFIISKQKNRYKIPKEIGVLIPMNTRDRLSESIIFGNNVGLLNISIPFKNKKHIKTPFDYKLFNVKKQMDYIKNNMFGPLSCKILSLLGYLPKWMTFMWLNEVQATAVISNVAGPNKKLIFCEEDVIHAFGIVQNHNSISLSFSIVSYNGIVSLSLYADNNINGSNTANDIMKYIECVLMEKGCLDEQ